MIKDCKRVETVDLAVKVLREIDESVCWNAIIGTDSSLPALIEVPFEEVAEKLYIMGVFAISVWNRSYHNADCDVYVPLVPSVYLEAQKHYGTMSVPCKASDQGNDFIAEQLALGYVYSPEANAALLSQYYRYSREYEDRVYD